MKKILLAMDNEVLLEQLKKCGKYLVAGYDIDTKENVIEYLKKHDADVLITKENLNGEINVKEYMKIIKAIRPNIKIIMMVIKLTDEVKGFLLANNVNNIIEGSSVSFSKVLEMIESRERDN